MIGPQPGRLSSPLPRLPAFVELLDWMARGGHERVLAVQDRALGLRAWIALHHTARGPAYGGIRVWSYRDDTEALLDALRLSRTMTFKCVLAGVRGGGAKTVVLADRLRDRSAAMTRLGSFIEGLNGDYRCGPDLGFLEDDRRAVAGATRYYAHHPEDLRPAGEATAEGAVWGIKAALEHRYGIDLLDGIRVAIQGLGAVGSALATFLLEEGAVVIGADISKSACDRARAKGVKIVDPGRIFETEAEVFAPCALGGALHDLRIARLRVPIVAGCANNILARAEHAQTLRERGILFVPDFVMNSGALIEGVGFEESGCREFHLRLQRIGDTVRTVLSRAQAADCTPTEAAVELAQSILESEREKAAAGTVESRDDAASPSRN